MKILKTKAFLVLVVFGLFTFQSCKKPLPTVLPSVTLGPITEITDVSAKVEINVISDGRGSVSDAGVKINSTGCANCSGNFTFVTSTRMGKSVINLTGLKKATTYNILAFVTNEIGTYNTVEITFSTSATAPIIKDDTNVISLIKATTAKVGNFQILDDGGATAFYSGICWSTNPNPTIADFKTRDTILNKAYLGLNSSLLNLKANTKYYIRPYAINTVGVGDGKELSFTTDPNNSCQPNAIEPESSVMQILPVGNDKFMLIGQFRNINGLENFNAALFNNDGSFDNNFAAIASDYGYNYFQLNNSNSIEPRFGIVYNISQKSSFNFGYGLHSQLQPINVYFLQSTDNNANIVYNNKNLDFTKSHHFVLGYNMQPFSDWRIKTEVYYQFIYNVPVLRYSSSYSMLNTGSTFKTDLTDSLINSGTGKNYGIELTVEKFFSKGYYGLLTGSLYNSLYVGSDGIQRNTAFNGRYVYNILAGKEWKIGKAKKNCFALDIKFTHAGGRAYTPIDLMSSIALEHEVVSPDSYSSFYSNYYRMDIKAGLTLNSSKRHVAQTISLDLQNVTNHKNVFSESFDRKTNSISTTYQLGFFPNVVYKIQF